jgi:gliding motility-associated protein GldC
MMEKSTITLDVHLDEQKVPSEIYWNSSSATADERAKAKAFILSLWDGAEKTALRIDIWTKEMMVDEMADFFYQTMITMADTYDRATHDQELVDDMRNFAKSFYQKFRAKQVKENKLT